MAEPLPVPGYNTCDWPVVLPCSDAEWDTFAPEVQEWAQALAGVTLRRLVGYRVGGCPVTVRPCKAGCSQGLLPIFNLDTYHGSSFYPQINAAGYWINSCGCMVDCSCGQLCEVVLPGPVGAVYEVKVNGDVIPSSDYKVHGTHLIWTGAGECPWPTCQDMSKPDTADGTFSITYLNAYEVDQLGAAAAGSLALEFARSCVGGPCQLPATVTTLTRQGVTMEIEAGAFPNGLTGIRMVDAYIGLWNPEGLRQQSQVWSPSMRQARIGG